MSFSRYINHAKSWRDLLNEYKWKRSQDYSTTEKISFPLDPDKLKRVKVRWPNTYQWAGARNFVQDIEIGMKRFVEGERGDVPQPYKGVVLIQVFLDGICHDVAIDYSDYMQRIEADCLKNCALYFKMQYFSHGYDREKFDLDKIIPGGFVNGSSLIYKYLPHIRSKGNGHSPIYEVYGRFGLGFAKDIRKRAIQLLQDQKEFKYEGGLRKVRYSRSLLETAQSKICIDLPGNGDFCFRLTDYLAVGACIIGPRHRTILHVPLVDRKHIVYAKDDVSDLVSLCCYYLKNDTEREMIRQNSLEYFEKYLHREQLAAYYLYNCLKKLG